MKTIEEPREAGYYMVRTDKIFFPAYYAGMGYWFFVRSTRSVDESKIKAWIPAKLTAKVFDDQLEEFKRDAIKIVEKYNGDTLAIIQAIKDLYEK